MPRNRSKLKTPSRAPNNFLTFNGELIYLDDPAEISAQCRTLLKIAGGDPMEFGFDLEWPVFFDGREAKTALMQMCWEEECCYLFHIYNLAYLPKSLLALLRHRNVTLTGINIQYDIQKLARDFNVNLTSVLRKNVVDLNDFANEQLNFPKNKRWGLASLTHYLFDVKLNKKLSVRASDWSRGLSQAQLEYAATDAYASWLCYDCLCDY